MCSYNSSSLTDGGKELYVSLGLYRDHQYVGELRAGGGTATGSAAVAQQLVSIEETVINDVGPICVCVYICMYMYECVRMYMYMCVCVCVCALEI